MMNSRSNSHTKDATVFQPELFLLPVLLIIYILLVVVALDMTGSNSEVTFSAIIVRALQNPYSSYSWREDRCNDGW